MNPNTQFERDLEQWLQAEAPASAPASFHASVMDRARTLRQRPGWATSLPVRRFGRGRGMTLLAAAALLLVGGALVAGSGLLKLPSVVPPVPEPSVIAVATASPDAAFPGPSESAAPSANPIPVAGPGGAWIATGTMGTPRFDHTAVRLLDGRVLVAGNYLGDIPESVITSAELYDPVTGTWSATGNMIRPHGGFPATLLRDGRVLVGDLGGPTSLGWSAGAEVYDPDSATWTATGKMVAGGSSATLLRDGTVLVLGRDGSELYDPDSGIWTATRSRPLGRAGHAAILLPDGRVLVAGGWETDDQATASAELYDPNTGAWTAAANMNVPREGLAAILLPDGRVLVAGGHGHHEDPTDSAELYDPDTGAWTAAADMHLPRQGHAAILLPDGRVLVAGGWETDEWTDSAELYDPGTGSWTAAAPMLRSHNRSPLTLLLDGTVLVAGGDDCLPNVCVGTGSAELYIPAGASPPPLPAFPSPPPPVFPSPTPIPSLVPPEAGPVPPNAHPWTVTVVNKSSNPATLFVAEEDERGSMARLVGSATPNVVPPNTTVQVTFLLPAKGVDGWSIFVNPGPNNGLVGSTDVPLPGYIHISEHGQVGWVSP